METEPLNHSESAEGADHELSARERIGRAMADLKATGDSGASWFFYIAVLSLVNTAVIHLGANRQFAIGLGITWISDVIATVVGRQNPQLATTAIAISICFSFLIASIAVLFGRLSRQRYNSVFGCGMFLYLLDGLLFLLIPDYYSVAFHAYVIYGMYRGIRAYQQLRRLEDAVEQAMLENPASAGFQPAPEFETGSA